MPSADGDSEEGAFPRSYQFACHRDERATFFFLMRLTAGVVLAWLAQAIAREVVVDDTDTRITYYSPSDAWIHSAGTQLTADRYAGSTSWTFAVGASASLKFTGSSITFVSFGDAPAAEFRSYLDFDITLDGTHYVGNTFVAQGEKQAQHVVFSRGGLDPTREHTITVTRTQPPTHDEGFNVDAFIYTVDDDVTSTTPPPVQPTTNQPATGTQGNQPASSQPNSPAGTVSNRPASQAQSSSTGQSGLIAALSEPSSLASSTGSEPLSAATGSPATASQPTVAGTDSQSPLGAIVGGVIGGLALICFVVLFVWYHRRRPIQYIEAATTPFVAISDPATNQPQMQSLVSSSGAPQVLIASPNSKQPLPSITHSSRLSSYSHGGLSNVTSDPLIEGSQSPMISPTVISSSDDPPPYSRAYHPSEQLSLQQHSLHRNDLGPSGVSHDP